jgi:hypothetical protein
MNWRRGSGLGSRLLIMNYTDRDPSMLLPLNKNGKFSMNAAKKDQAKIEKAKKPALAFSVVWENRLVAVFVLVFMTLLFVLFIYGQSVKAQIVPADGYIYGTTGTSPNIHNFGYASGVGDQDVSQLIPTSTIDRALCGVDFRLLKQGNVMPNTYNVNMRLHRDTPFGGITYTPIPSSFFYEDLPTIYNPNTSTMIFDPCVTLLANKQYWVTFGMVPGSPGNSINLFSNVLSNASGSFSTLDSAGNVQVYAGEVLLLYAYGYTSLSGYDAPVSSEYGFSSSSSLGTDQEKAGNFITDALKYMFIPSPDAAAGYDSNKTILLERAPVGYFVLAQNAFLGLATTTVSSTNILIKTSLGTIDLWDTSTTKSSILWTGLSPWLFGIERVGMWCGFLFYLYIRSRDLVI